MCVSVTRCVHWVCISWHTHTHTNNTCTFSFCSAPAYLTHGHRKINVISDNKLILKHILLSLWKREMKVDLDVNMCLPSQTVIWKWSSHHSPAKWFFLFCLNGFLVSICSLPIWNRLKPNWISCLIMCKLLKWRRSWANSSLLTIQTYVSPT